MYQRKTRDCWRIYINYGQGWEHECTEFSWRDAVENIRAYRQACPQYSVRMRHGRERIEG